MPAIGPGSRPPRTGAVNRTVVDSGADRQTDDYINTLGCE
jgi:hypothetical protein